MRTLSLVATFAALQLPLQANVLDKALEQRVSCPNPQMTDVTTAPSYLMVRAAQDSYSRFVDGYVRWHLNIYSYYYQATPNSGFELATHYYNYSDSVGTGYGPAYVKYPNPDAWFKCDLPGCYPDTALGSNLGNYGYEEPKIGIGIRPPLGSGTALMHNRNYYWGMRATAGQGRRSKMKVLFDTTTNVYPSLSPEFGMFKCNNVPHVKYVGFEENVYAPTCMHISYKPPYPHVSSRSGC